MSKAQEFELLLQCYRSGQMTERQWREHLKDPAFRAWLDRQDSGIKSGTSQTS